MAETLPITRFRDAIINAVKQHTVVIIKAETGAGKSTQVPQFLLACASRVIITQPRRLAARTLAARVAEEMSCALGGLVGYRTALERKDSRATRILFCTDGLELIRELIGERALESEVLIMDEIHEWNLQVETLIAWVKHRMKEGAQRKVVIMSATLETGLLETFFDDAVTIEVPGRCFPVQERKTSGDIVTDTARLLDQGHNVLMFQPGKAEIRKTIERLEHRMVDADILPLHADMGPEDQVPCFLSYDRPKCIVSTNVAQTSITISDIDAVVDSGMERRIENLNGVEGLYLRPISLMDREQRKGRAGRTRPGIFIDACLRPIKERRFIPKPEILRLGLEHVVLRFTQVGIDAATVEFFHKPDLKKIEAAKQTLLALGCIDSDGRLTVTGYKVAQLPIAVRLGRMIVEAQHLGVTYDVITLAAILEQGGITNNQSTEWMRFYAQPIAGSDALVELAAYEAAYAIPHDRLEQFGINAIAFKHAQEARSRLRASLPDEGFEIKTIDPSREGKIIQALVAGMRDCFYQRALVEGYKDAAGNMRKLPRGSIVGDARFIVGLPWNLQVNGAYGPRTLRFIRMATEVPVNLLEDLAQHLMRSDPLTGERYFFSK